MAHLDFPDGDNFFPILFGLNDEEREEFRRLIEPDDFNALVRGQVAAWYVRRLSEESECQIRRDMLVLFIRESGIRIHIGGEYSMDLVLAFSHHLLHEVEREIEADKTI